MKPSMCICTLIYFIHSDVPARNIDVQARVSFFLPEAFRSVIDIKSNDAPSNPSCFDFVCVKIDICISTNPLSCFAIC